MRSSGDTEVNIYLPHSSQCEPKRFTSKATGQVMLLSSTRELLFLADPSLVGTGAMAGTLVARGSIEGVAIEHKVNALAIPVCAIQPMVQNGFE
jgi:hypothetical protein